MQSFTATDHRVVLFTYMAETNFARLERILRDNLTLPTSTEPQRKKWRPAVTEAELIDAVLEGVDVALTPKPELYSCPKCGSKSAERQHFMPGIFIHGMRLTQRPMPYKSRFAHGDNNTITIDKECIAHVCRDCGYAWETAPLS